MSVSGVGGSDTNFKSGGGGEAAPKELSKEDVAKLIEALIESLTKKKDEPEEAGGAGGGDKAGGGKAGGAGGGDKAGGAGGGDKAGGKGDPKETVELLEKLMNGEKLSPEEMKKLEKGTGLKAENLEKIQGDGKEIK